MLHRTLAATVTTIAALALTAAPAVAQSIQPGESITMDGSYCTLNWIYDGTGTLAGKVYGGTAAHCVESVGQEVSLATGSPGETIERIGQVAFRGDPDPPGRDYAFIEIDAEDLGQVNPALKGHPAIPTGVSTGYQEGDLMQFSGYGVGFDLTQPTRERRVGVLNWTDGVQHDILGGVTPGDSGGPVADITDGDTAFGIVNTVGVGVNTGALTVATAGEGGANLDFVLRDAGARGFTVTLRTVGSGPAAAEQAAPGGAAHAHN
jgi:hypothetical protein